MPWKVDKNQAAKHKCIKISTRDLQWEESARTSNYIKSYEQKCNGPSSHVLDF